MRVESSIKNIKYNIISQVMNLLIQFITRTIFIKILGNMYLGINGLFTNILTILSLADMGIGTVLVFSMYKPLAEKDEKKLKQLMNIYKKIYNSIAISVFIVGILLIPFLRKLINDIPEINNIEFIYFLYLLNTIVSYLCVYKISIINADQKNYIVTIIQQIFNIISNILIIIVLILTKNFIAYLLVKILFSILCNIFLSKKANQMYPFIKNTKGCKLEKEEINCIKKNTVALLLHKIGGVVVNGTDNLVMYAFVGLDSVGIYSNYLLILDSVKRFTLLFFTSLTASIGNLYIEKDIEYTYKTFKSIFFCNFWIYTFCTVCLFCLLNPFIEIWIGTKYTLNMFTVSMIVLVFYIDGMRQTVQIFKDAMGIFRHDQLRPIIEAILNLIISILLAKKIGIAGVLLGTAISMFGVTVWVETFMLYKYGFKKKFNEYISLYIRYGIIAILTLLITYIMNKLFINSNSIFALVIRFVITILVANIIILSTNYNKDEFKYFKNIIFIRLHLDKLLNKIKK